MTEQFISSVMMLFRRGWNTADIARQWTCRESEVYRALVIGRERERSRRP